MLDCYKGKKNYFDFIYVDGSHQAPDVLLDAAYVKAQEIMLNSPIGVALTKEGMWASLEIPGLQAAIDMENRQQIMASFSDDARETQRAKREGRPPQYRS